MILRDYQNLAVDSIFEYFEVHGGTNEEGFPIKANPIIAMQTGLGKSIVIAEFFKRALQFYPQTRGLMVTHDKNLIQQNAEKLRTIWPQVPLGIYSAGLKQKQNFQPIIYGGVRSMVGKYPVFGYRDFIVIDEVHRVSDDDQASYMKLIWELMYGPDVKPGVQPTKEQFQKALNNPNCNPYLKIIGLSASPFRQGLGMLTNGPIFTHFCYNSCTVEGWAKMLAQGYLAPVYPKATRTTMDVTGVKVQKGEFNQTELQARIDTKDINQRCLLESIETFYATNRKRALIFATGIEHAEHIAELMNNVFNEECVIYHSGNKEFARADGANEKALALLKSGQVKWGVNVNSLTTGIDIPELDLCVGMRPTMSSNLWVQINGRFTRPCPGKDYAIHLDFAGNCARLGPIDDPRIPKMKTDAEGEMPVKICQACGFYNHARATECLVCSEPFPINSKLVSTASQAPIISGELPIVESFNVKRVIYTPHEGKASHRRLIKVAYHCDKLKTFFEYITLEGKDGKIDYAAKKGRDWFRQRHPTEPPLSNETVLLLSNQFRQPAKINVWVNKRPNPEVLGAEFI